MIMEKERAYKDDADHYEKAWKFSGEASPSIGFKLAFNYLKAKQFVEATNVISRNMSKQNRRNHSALNWEKMSKMMPMFQKMQKSWMQLQ